MILVAIGSNLPHPVHGVPLAVCEAAVKAISEGGCTVTAQSRWFRSAAVPKSDQPDFVNGVISVETSMAPAELLIFLHRIEAKFDRQRSEPNAARTLDLDLLVFGKIVNKGPVSPIIPHPRMIGRAFVLLPLRDIKEDWKHPVSHADLADLIAALPPDQDCVPLET
jgi:2-amino-4-hydroxy-6-hydroxymethyldihydropteridine diphosphokinase